MNRKWRLGRVVLAVVLVGMAGLVWRFWAVGPRWGVGEVGAGSALVGFDAKRGVLVTVSPGAETQTLRSYDVRTGGVVGTRSLRLGASGWVTAWPMVLGPGGEVAAALSVQGESGHVVPVAPGGRAVELRTRNGSPPGWPVAYGFSADGGWLATCVERADAGYDMLNVWELATGTPLFQARLPHQKHMSGGPGVVNFLPPEVIHMTADRRFVVAQLLDRNTVIYDVAQKQIVLRVELGGYPRFSVDGRMMVILPVEHYGRRGIGAMEWYVQEGGNWVPANRPTTPLRRGEHLVNFDRDAFATALREVDAVDPEWLKWMPESVRRVVLSLWQKNQLRVHLRSLQTGEALDQVVVRAKLNEDLLLGMILARMLLAFSWEGKLYVAVMEGETLRLWESQPRRPLACWLTCGGLALVAAWLAWPRRGTVAGA